ncbi:hypothetical protein T02_10595 [Trichinella nativa]|uniref:Uncharacterized protein n=1 Tax=Trichinella nativa TaxID=6335 RepID=A0A0V1LSS8_9BILA|nr:hypothetical protein T02_10595 [Trichinella nativa]
MGPLIGSSSARFWRNHMYIAESSSLFDTFFINFHEEQLLEVSICDTKPVTVSASHKVDCDRCLKL